VENLDAGKVMMSPHNFFALGKLTKIPDSLRVLELNPIGR
jgi:hypothetical protein